MNNTRARNEELGQAALAYCAAHGISAHPISRAHCVAFATAQGCTVETARRHLTRALSYTQRGPDAVPPGWGGMRPGAGRRPKASERHKPDETEPAAGIVPAAFSLQKWMQMQQPKKSMSSRAGINAWVCWGGYDGKVIIAYQRSETRPGPDWSPLYPPSRLTKDSYRPYDGRSEWELIANEAMASATGAHFQRRQSL